MNQPQSKDIVKCRSCGKDVAITAPSCPHCGEAYPGLSTKCPKCGSKKFIVQPKGFSLGKAGLGAVLLGPAGLIGGFHGSKDINLKCTACNNTWKPSF